jgi:ribosomal-protein-alanine N-acetyltransferase
MDLTIRRMTWDDLPAALLIDVMSFTLPWTQSAYVHEMKNPAARPWVAEATLEAPLRYEARLPFQLAPIEKRAGEKAVVAVAVIWLIVDEAHLATIAVHPDLRGMGIGRALMQALLEQSAQDGAHSALLEVRAGNVAAQKLYESFGFTVVGRRPHYYRDNQEDALLMTLEPLNGRMFKSSGVQTEEE